jgi:hypothetical protein
MSAEERQKILQMVEEGKISAEQAASLMRALAEDTNSEGGEVLEVGPAFSGEGNEAPEFEEVKRRARNFAMIPLWVGIFITALSAWGIVSVQRNAGMNFWFFCLIAPLFLGILLITLMAAGQNSKWLYVNVDRRNAQDWPRNITFGMPLPLGLAAWFLRTFGRYIRGMEYTNVDEIIQILDATGKSGAPLIVNANDNEDGENVQVYIG